MTTDHPALPAIRTAMRMSRRTFKTDKGRIRLAVEMTSPTETSPSAVPEPKTSVSALNTPLARSSESSVSSNSSNLSASSYLDPIPGRKVHWAPLNLKNAELLYENWENDECRLDRVSVDPPQSKKTHVSTFSLRTPAQKPVLFRPKQRKSSHIAYVSPPQRPIQVKIRSQKSCCHLPTPPQPVHVETERETNASNRDIKIYPVVKLTQIDSCELDSSSSDQGDVMESIRERRKFKSRKQGPIPTNPPVQAINSPQSMKYREESAQVLGDTSSLLRRRSERLVIAARLLRDI